MFLKRKRRSATKVNYVFFIILEHSYLLQILTFWKLVHVFFAYNILEAIGGWPPAGHFTLEKLSELQILESKIFHSFIAVQK